ncbi:M20/M25/M40 family metallo-hydrolase [Sphingomonas sabuli]|uniref:M20/M25/M40 family metallo-hydrolase n=2 Tax=Sphingomonas sabuli TaxID=2764186 RepID=A0A7G9L5W5_9SPHN|nr:M20/M25/M40 family metallo-hydrolase [Sphingomonas sabuli]
MRRLSVLIPIIAVAGCATAPVPSAPPADVYPAGDPYAPKAPPPPVPAAEITTERMSEITRVLASDEMLGRAPGGPAEQKTVDYLIAQFQGAGLEPAGENGGWTQRVPMIHTQLTGPLKIDVRHGGTTDSLSPTDDVSMTTVLPVSEVKIVDAPMVFVGYGVTAPERGWDDFKDVDLKGKVALFLVNDPDFQAAAGDDSAGKFGDKTMTYYGRWTYKYEEAARRGAIAAMVVHETDGAGYGWNVAGSSAGENYAIELPAGAPRPPMLQGWIQRPAAERLLKRAGLDYATLKRQARSRAFQPVDMKSTYSASTAVTVEQIVSQNVLGKLTGASRPDEVVSYGGHWDAYGQGEPDAQGRTVRPGAADDALGLAAMIEIARKFASRPRTERTLLFAAWTGEESGLLGSEYYAQRPLYPAEKMVANLTLDTLQWAGPVKDALLIGKGQSEMETILAEEAAKQGRYVTVEGHPERGLFYRADHFSFAKRGVPVLLDMALAGAYDLETGGREAGEKWLSDFTGTCYHQTCDAWSANWDLRGAKQEADLFYAIGARLANGRAWPQWLPSSEFRKVREESAAQRR